MKEKVKEEFDEEVTKVFDVFKQFYKLIRTSDIGIYMPYEAASVAASLTQTFAVDYLFEEE